MEKCNFFPNYSPIKSQFFVACTIFTITFARFGALHFYSENKQFRGRKCQETKIFLPVGRNQLLKPSWVRSTLRKCEKCEIFYHHRAVLLNRESWDSRFRETSNISTSKRGSTGSRTFSIRVAPVIVFYVF